MFFNTWKSKTNGTLLSNATKPFNFLARALLYYNCKTDDIIKSDAISSDLMITISPLNSNGLNIIHTASLLVAMFIKAENTGIVA